MTLRALAEDLRVTPYSRTKVSRPITCQGSEAEVGAGDTGEAAGRQEKEGGRGEHEVQRESMVLWIRGTESGKWLIYPDR